LNFPATQDVMLRSVLALAACGAIGFEREIRGRTAGFRTHLLVGLGAALIMMLSLALGNGSADRGRLAAQVVSGIGFLGAGTILSHGNVVRGLTTAASIWLVAGLGLAAGAGWIEGTLAITLLALVALTLMRLVEDKWVDKLAGRTLSVRIRMELEVIHSIASLLEVQGVRIKTLSFDDDWQEGTPGWVTFNLAGPVRTADFAAQLTKLPGVFEVALD